MLWNELKPNDCLYMTLICYGLVVMPLDVDS